MRITESQLRRIIRQEVRSLREGGMSSKFNDALSRAETETSGSNPDYEEVVDMAIDAINKGKNPAIVLRAIKQMAEDSGGGWTSDDVIRTIKQKDRYVAGELARPAGYMSWPETLQDY